MGAGSGDQPVVKKRGRFDRSILFVAAFVLLVVCWGRRPSPVIGKFPPLAR